MTEPKPLWPKFLVGGIVLVLFVAIAVGNGKKKEQQQQTATAATSTTTQAAPVVAGRPSPTDDDIRTLAAQLVAIQPEMAAVPYRRIESWSDSMCADIIDDPGGNMTLAERAAYRFSGGDRPPLTDRQGQQIVDAISTVYCH